MVHIPLPVRGATNSEAVTAKSLVRRRQQIQATDALTDEHSVLPPVKQRQGSDNKQKTRPEFYRYRKQDNDEKEESEELTYEDKEHPHVHLEDDSHKGQKLDLSC